MSKLSYLLTLTPRETWRIARHKLPILRSGASWTPGELMSSSKHTRGIRFAELLMRQEAVVTRCTTWRTLDFADKHVVEVGCGPLAGYGPLAIFNGARSFSSAEPEWDPSLMFSATVIDKYLRILHADLVALYGPRMDFDTFLTALGERMAIARTGFEKADITEPADIVLSQSVLEHIFPLEDTIKKLADIQTPQTQFLHLVDFGNHYPTSNPFEGLYEQPAEAYIARRGKAINCLRMSDIAALFDQHEIAATAVPSRYVESSYTGTISQWWRQKYENADLFTQLCLIAGNGTD